MRRYPIHIRHMDDFRNYVNMIARFTVAGYVQSGDTAVNMYCLLDIISGGRSEEMELLITKYRQEDLEAFEAYLYEKDLIRTETERDGEGKLDRTA